MANYARLHVTEFAAFTFPIVMGILKEGPLPKAIQRIPSPFRERLVATLALELAAICVMVVQRGRRSDWLHDREQDLLRKHGGQSYLALLHEAERLRLQHKAIVNEQRELGYHIRSYLSSAAERGNGAIKGRGATGQIVYGRNDSRGRRFVAEHRRKVALLLGREADVGARVRAASSALKSRSARIRRSAAFQEDFLSEAWLRTKVDFNRSGWFQSTGAAYYLRNADGHWWEMFTQLFTAKANQWGAPLRIALRDPDILYAIQARVTPKVGWFEAAQKFFATGMHVSGDEKEEWGVRNDVSIATIKEACKLLRLADRNGMMWLKECGCPSNFYTFWIARQESDVLRESKKVSKPRVPMRRANQKWLNSLINDFGRGIESFSDEQCRLNELSWCLSSQLHGAYRFVPILSSSLTAADWDAHLAKWLSAIDRASRRRK